MGNKLQDQVGLRYGRWVVKEYGKVKGYTKYVICVCDCGIVKEIAIGSLRNGDSASCGCYNKDASRLRKTIHGLRDHVLYGTYQNIKNRCQCVVDKRYPDYGGRGIKLEWETFEDFYNDMHEGYTKGLQIDRINNDGNYCKDNCRWVTPRINSQNRRNTVMTTEMIAGCELRGIKYKTVYQRMQKYGMSWEDAINKNTR